MRKRREKNMEEWVGWEPLSVEVVTGRCAHPTDRLIPRRCPLGGTGMIKEMEHQGSSAE
jgi:hypothetical protein